MKRYSSQTRVEGGYYLNTTSWEIKAVDGQAGELPGAAGTTSVRMATPVMIVAALILSFLFVIFLPSIGLVLFAGVVGAFALKALLRASLAMTHLFAPQWRPGEAWLARLEKPAAKTPAPSPESLEALRTEVEARRTAETPKA